MSAKKAAPAKSATATPPPPPQANATLPPVSDGDVELPTEEPTPAKSKKVTQSSILADLKDQHTRLKQLIEKDATRGRRRSLANLESSIAELEK